MRKVRSALFFLVVVPTFPVVGLLGIATVVGAAAGAVGEWFTVRIERLADWADGGAA